MAARASLIIVALFSLGAMARADEQALPCRPTIACTADLVVPGAFEIEAGYLARAYHDGSWQHSTPLLLKLTLARFIQLQLGSNGFVALTPPSLHTHYVDDILAGVKLHAHDQTPSFPSLSLSLTASIPTAPQPGYVRTWDALVIVYVTKDIRWLHADLNLGLNLWQLEGPVALQPWIALALSMSLPRSFGVMIEGYDFIDAKPISPADAGILAAVSYSPRRWIIFDLGGDVALTGARVASLFVGMTVVSPRLWGRAKGAAVH